MVYRKHPYISFSELMVYNNYGFAAFFEKKFNPNTINVPTSAQVFGTMIHSAILEAETFQRKYVPYTGTVPSSANMKKFVEEIAQVGSDPKSAYINNYSVKGLTDAAILKKAEDLYASLEEYINIISNEDTKDCVFITPEQYDLCLTLQRTFWQSFEDILYLESTTEYQIIDDDLCLKGTVDLYTYQGLLCDLKTTNNNNPHNFVYSIHKYNYLLQLAFYRRLLGATGVDIKSACIVAINSSEPHTMTRYDLTKESLSNLLVQANAKIDRLLNNLYQDANMISKDLIQDSISVTNMGELVEFYSSYANAVNSHVLTVDLSHYLKDEEPLTAANLSNLLN